MAGITAPFPVKLFAGVLTAQPGLLEAVKIELIKRHGPVDHETGIMPFNFTDYYNEETGSPIIKKFWSFERLVPPDSLAEIKIETNRIEERFAGESDLKRPVNVDPGYITLAKVVLATAKDFPHRIYIGKGIYAEVTLTYEDGSLRSHRWTYADYKQDSYRKFFSKMRKTLLEQGRNS